LQQSPDFLQNPLSNKPFNMNLQKLLFTLIALVGFTYLADAQDMILKRNDEIIKCKIREIGLDEVKYILPDFPADLFFSIEKDDIKKVIFEGGKEMTFEKAMTNPEHYTENKKNAMKVDFMSPLTGNTTFSFEHSLKPGRSLETSLGIIGLGLDPNDNNAGGVFAKFGMKFIKDPDFYLRGMRYAHILKGSYVKPEIAFGFFGRNTERYYDEFDNNGNWIGSHFDRQRESVFSGTAQLVIGKQWVFDNAFLVDMYWGLGYGFGTDEYGGGYYYGYAIADQSFPISFSAGLKIGLLLK